MADGSVKPAQAASAPLYPARDSPTAMPTWLSTWQELTKRDEVSALRSENQRRRVTNSARK